VRMIPIFRSQRPILESLTSDFITQLTLAALPPHGAVRLRLTVKCLNFPEAAPPLDPIQIH
jgi:hypothetical protein